MLLDITKLKNYEKKLQEKENQQQKTNCSTTSDAILQNRKERENIVFLNSDCIQCINKEEIDYKEVIIFLKDNTKKIIFSFIYDYTREEFLKTLSCMINNNQK
jgi:hypothetical protein